MSPLVIFDCDGVLVDSELLEHGVDAELLGPMGYAASAQELLQRFVGIARTDMYKTVFDELGREMPHGLLDEREKRVWQRCHSDLRTVPGVEEALEALRQQPKCVASSSLPAKLQLKLESTGLARHFAPHVFSTALVARGKPAPDIYLHAAQAVGHATSDLRTVPGVEEALEALRQQPKCVASSSLPAKLQLKLESTGLTRHFAPHVFSTALVARGKPAPDIYLHAARAVGHATNDCIVVEDSPHGIAGARAAGMRAIGFTGGSHATPSLAIELRLAGAVLVVDHMVDLPKAIESMVVEMPGAGYP